MRPVRYDLTGDRGIEFDDQIAFVGFDLTGSTKRAQIRLTPDASALLTAINVSLGYGGSATVAAHIAAGRLTNEVYGYGNPTTGANYAPADVVLLSVFALNVAANRMVAPYIPAVFEAGDDVTAAWDLLITPSGGVEQKFAYGDFVVRGTVTQ